jgi:Glycosyltransferase family 9 (heptosyltransferase)
VLWGDELSIDESSRLIDRALQIDPHSQSTRFQKGLLLLERRHLAQAFDYLESRLRFEPPIDSLSLWDGSSANGKHIVTWIDWGGLGDNIELLAYVEQFCELHKGVRLSFVCPQELVRLAKTMHSFDLVVSNPDLIEAPDYHLPLASLARHVTVSGWTPSRIKLFNVAERDVQDCRVRLTGLPRPWQGLCWVSGYWGDAPYLVAQQLSKSLNRSQLETHFSQIPGSWVKLQNSALLAEDGGIRFPALRGLMTPMLPFADMYDTAAMIMALDVSVSVDTSVLHLASALGAPTIGIVKARPGRFVGECGEKMPQWERTRICRQTSAGDWSSALQLVIKALSAPLQE